MDGNSGKSRVNEPVTEDEVVQMIGAMFSGGLSDCFKAQRAAANRLGERYDELENDHSPGHAAEFELISRFLNPLNPAWQQITGLFPRDEKYMSPNERAKRIRALLTGVERLLRYEMQHAEELEMLDDEGRWAGRSLQWDPLRAICVQLELAQKRLSAFSKEQTGLSAIELVDCVRVEELRGKMKAELKGFVTEFFSRKDAKAQGTETAKSSTEYTEGTEENVVEQVWRALKEARRGPRWHRSTWAAGFGFSSYQKFFRASLLCYGMTPHQLEIELIKEILSEAEADEKNGGHEGREEKWKEHEGENENGESEVVKRE